MSGPNNIKKDTISGVKWTSIENIALSGSQFLIGIVLARRLDPEDFGLVGMLAIFIAISTTFIDSGFSNALIRKPDRTEIDYHTTFHFNFVVGITCYILLFLASPWIADFFNKPILSDLLKVLAITLFVNSLSVVQIARLTINLNFKAQTIATISASVISGAIGIAMAYTGHGVWSLVWQQVFNSIFKTLIVWIQAKWVPKFKFSTKSFKALFSFGSKLLAASIIGTIYKHITTISIGKFYTSKDLGFYSRGSQFAHFPVNVIMTSLGKVTFPILAKIQEDDSKLISVYRKYIRITSLVIIFVIMLMAAIAKPLILIVLTEKWSDAIIYMQIFCLAYMFEHISTINLNLLNVKGRSDLFLKLEVIKKIIAFIILIAAIPLGVLAICLSKVIYSIIALFINTYYTGKLFNLGIKKQIEDFGKYTILSFLSCIPSFISTYLIISPWLTLPISSIVAIALYTLCLQNDLYFKELKSLTIERFRFRKNNDNQH